MTTTTTGAMASPAPRAVSRYRVTQGKAQSTWGNLSPRVRVASQLAVFVAVVAVAYSYSLTTLFQLADFNTPLSYISLVPFIALGLAAVHREPSRWEPPIHDRQTDYIIGLPLMGLALFINYELPSRLSAMFWVWRIDLLTLPFFVAGAVAVIFGVRVLWRQKLAVGFLFLAWPYPYSSALLWLLNAFTTATLFGISHILDVFHVAKPVPSLDNTVFSIVHNGQAFNLSVVSACSGVNSVVGFLLIGSAFATIVKGPLVRKMVWLLGGMLLLWVFNLARIIIIFWTGRHYGESFAINVLHPFIGLVMFIIGVGIMIICIGPMGLTIGVGDPRAQGQQAANATGDAGGRPVRPLAVPKFYVATAVVIVIAVLLGMNNISLRAYNLVANVSGQSKLISYIDQPVTPQGWTWRYQTTFSWAEPLFGDTSQWNRYTLYPRTGGDLHAQTDVVADVIDTPDLQAFSAYGVEQCYQFHGFALANVAQVSLGGGITGQSLAYDSQQYGSWTIVYWIVPVKIGVSTEYERVVLYVQNQRGVIAKATEGDDAGIRNLSGSLSAADATDVILRDNRDFIVAYARELIVAQADRSAAVLARRKIV
jgi:exosortase/archaeosortase family protein